MIRAAAGIGFVLVVAGFIEGAEPVAPTGSRSLPAGALMQFGDPRLILTGQAHRLAFSPTGNILAVTSDSGLDSDRSVHLFDLRTGLEFRQLVADFRGRAADLQLAFTVDGSEFWAGNENWNPATWQRLGQQIPANNSSLAVTTDGKYLAAIGHKPNELILWNVRSLAGAVALAYAEVPSETRSRCPGRPAPTNTGGASGARTTTSTGG
ncbi:MAG TPA: WD40 repeat domain-containing protein [Pirellulales bacterium]|nr:WD40 repeat domain-containing protein [Pirellulales bacterium]